MAIKGVDISENNGSVDFSALKNAGVQFVIIRLGYGGDYTSQDDSRFLENVKKAKAAGMPYGAYLYSYALNTSMAQSEVNHTLRVLKQVDKPEYGVWFDMEDADGYKQRSGMPSKETLVQICYTYCKAIQDAGYYCGIYAGLSWLNNQLNSTQLDVYDKWVAQWNATCDYKKEYGIWQYAGDNGPNVTKIGGKVFDMNYAYKDYPAVTKGGDSTVSSGFSKTSRVFSQQGNKIKRGFGPDHGGVDLCWDTDPQTPVVAHSAGTVCWVQTGIPTDTGSTGNRSYGNCVKVKHPNGYYTLYAHLSSVAVTNGQTVKAGQQIGQMGNTGNSYGAHLHFEVRNTGDARIDPAPYIDADLPGLPTTKEDEVDMTKDEVVALIRDTINQVDKEKAAKPASDWAKNALTYGVEHKIMTGDGDGKNLRPQANITRQEVMQMFYNVLTAIKTEDDLPKWAKEPIDKLIADGIVAGVGKTEDDKTILNISEELARMLMWMVRYMADPVAEEEGKN